jgi:class 3 adenylate cyclase/tetratricopeptide (TPR) repeat protein
VKCPSCQIDNREEARFCDSCGQKLAITPPEPLRKELSFDEKLEKIQKYLPSDITEKILSQRDKIEGEKRQVTVMFCDMKGFTPLADKLSPEEVYGMMDQVYEVLIHKVHDYEGTVNEMTGDGIMALFGAPIALEDAPQRAIRSAMAIHREMTRLNERMKHEKRDLPLIKMRIGIHTGPVVVGTLGNDLRVAFKAVGDTVNLASRMESLAEPGMTYISDDTFKLTEGFFQVEDLGEKKIKGKEKPIRVYRVISPTTGRTRFEGAIKKGLSPFVGRGRELSLLLERFEMAKQGRGQVISIVSEAGIGKSRLLYEFRKAVSNAYATFLVAQCLSYSRNVPYHPIADLLKANFEIQDTNTDQQIREKVTTDLEIMKIDKFSTLPYLLELLSVKESGIDKIPLSPEAKKNGTIEALKRIMLKGSEIRPLIMATEDLHWMDRSSEDVMKELLESIARARVFLIFTYRPEFVHTWGSVSYHSQVTLNPLPNRETLAMMTHILDAPYIDPTLEDLILQRTEGIPFFIEEFIKSLKDLGIIERKDKTYQLSKDVQKLSIPSTIQDVIMARFDDLPEGAKEVLRAGSVIEREFNHDLIKRVTGLPEQELLSHLSILKDSDLIYEQGIYPQSAYIFRHALSREVIYDSILTKNRKQIHEEIGNDIEALYKDKLDEHYGALVTHFMASQNYRKTADYSRLACLKAEKSVSLHEARIYGKKWIEALEQLPQTEELEGEIINSRTALGFYLFRMSNMVEAKECIDPISDVILKRGIKDCVGQAYVIIGSFKYMSEENFHESLEYLEKAIETSEQAGDFVTNVYARYMMGLVLAMNCNYEKAIPYFEGLLSLSIAMKFPWQISVMKSNLSVYAYNYHGMVSKGYQTSEDAVRIAEESGDIYSKAMAYASHGTSCYYRGLLEEAHQHLMTGINLTEKINMSAHNAMAHQWLGHVYFELGNYQEAQDHYYGAVHAREHSRLFPSSVNFNRIALIRAKLFSGEKDIDLDLMYHCLQTNRVKMYEGSMARYIGDILLHLNDCQLSKAEGWITSAIEADKRNGMRCDLGKDYTLYGEFFKKRGNPSRARECLEKSLEIFEECGADGWFRKAERALSKI